MPHSMPPGAAAPRLLLVGLLPGLGGMHMPRHLARTGCDLVFAGIDTCMASRSSHVRERLSWGAGSEALTVSAFIERCRPDWIVPIDELATFRLQSLARRASQPGASLLPPAMLALLLRSLGEPQGYALHGVRQKCHAIARSAGIAVPEQVPIRSLEDMIGFAARSAYPFVLKREQSMGGTGVFIVADENAARSLASRHKPGQEGTPWVAQAHVPGTLGMHAVFADQGQVLAAVGAVQIRRRSQRPTAPSSVVRLCSHEGMAAAAAAFVAASGASGFHGWDFQLDAHGEAVMIEHNPRPISITHLGGLIGSDLCAALAGLLGLPAGTAPVAGRMRDVALFPDEWRRDARSPLLNGPFHDAPWDDPALLAATTATRGRFV